MSRPVVALIQLGRTWVNVEAIETVDVYAEPDPRDKTTQISATRVRLRSGAMVFDDRPIRAVLEAMRAVTDDFPHGHPELDASEPFVQQPSGFIPDELADLLGHVFEDGPNRHDPVKHRDGLEPWCKVCGLAGGLAGGKAEWHRPLRVAGSDERREPDGIRGERTLHLVDDPAPRSMSVLPVRGQGEGLSE